MNLKGFRHLAAVQLNEPAAELTRGGHADLLAEHSTDGDLESIPASGARKPGRSATSLASPGSAER